MAPKGRAIDPLSHMHAGAAVALTLAAPFLLPTAPARCRRPPHRTPPCPPARPAPWEQDVDPAARVTRVLGGKTVLAQLPTSLFQHGYTHCINKLQKVGGCARPAKAA